MKRMIPMLVLLLVLAPSILNAQAKVTIKQVSGPVYLVQGDGGNVAVIADAEGAIMVDAMFERASAQIKEAIKTLPGGDKVRFLVNTHWHSDHTDGNKAFGPPTVIIAHENLKPLLEKSLPTAARPAKTFKDKLVLSSGGAEIRLVHYANAHTDGDTVVFIDKYKVVHLGDLFFNGMFPYIDAANGGNIDNWVRQLDAILAVLPADAKVIPGHGPLAGVPQLKAFRQMLFDSAALVRRQIKEGKSLAEIKAAGVPEDLKPWTYGFLSTPQWLELVYQTLEK